MSRRVRLLKALLNFHIASHPGWLSGASMETMARLTKKINHHKQKENAKRRAVHHTGGNGGQFEIEGLPCKKFEATTGADEPWRAGAS